MSTANESPNQFLERNLAIATRVMESETGAACNFDIEAVRWLERHLEGLRATEQSHRSQQVAPFGCLLGHCILTMFGGAWAMLNGSASGLAVKVRPNVFVIPWDKVEGFLGGDDGDSIVGFTSAIEHNYLNGERSEPAFIS